MKNGKLIYEIKIYIILTMSSILYAVAFCWFYQTNEISFGGFTGIAQILNHLLPALPIGITTLVLNIPLFAIAFKLQGTKILIHSLYCMATGSLLVDIIPQIHYFAPMQDKLLATIFGGALIGAASGIQIRAGATNGGAELTARLLKYKYRHISVGRLCLMVDLSIIIIYAIIFRQIYSALYGVLSIYIMSIAVDFVVYGGTHAKMAYIVSCNMEEIKHTLLSMNLGLTVIHGHGGYKNEDKQIILCAFKPHRIAALKQTVNSIDPDAFIIVCDAHEILGEGFGAYSPDGL